jgi:hypothetical protein
MSMSADDSALRAAAHDAERIAGDAYYAGSILRHPGPGRVTLYLAHAPEAVLEELEALHPGVYAILNAAPQSYSAVLELMPTLEIEELRAHGIEVVLVGPTRDGYLQVGILGPAVVLAQAIVDARYGCGVIRVFRTERPSRLDYPLRASAPVR